MKAYINLYNFLKPFLKVMQRGWYSEKKNWAVLQSLQYIITNKLTNCTIKKTQMTNYLLKKFL